MTIEEYISRPNKPQEMYLIDGIVPIGGRVSMYGQPKAGKTYMSLSAGLAIANPAVNSWFSWPVLKHGPVLYLSLDSAPGEWEQIYIQAASRTHYYAPGIPFYHVDDSMPPAPFDLMDVRTRAKDWVTEAVTWVTEKAGEPPVILFIDVFRNLYWGNEDKSEIQMAVLSILSGCAPGIATWVSHHGKKPPMEGDHDLMAGSRGSNYLPGNSSTIFRISSRTDGLRGKLEYSGRGCGNGKLPVMRPAAFNRDDKGSPNNFWQADTSQEVALLAQILNEMQGKPVNQMAEEMAKRCGSSKEACRARINRALGNKD